MIFLETTCLRSRCSLSPDASDSLNKTSRSGQWVQMKNTQRFYYMACLPSVDAWQVCAHSFTCTSWYKNKRGLSSCSVWYWAKPVPFLGPQSFHPFWLWHDLILPPSVQCSQVSLLPLVPLGSLFSWKLFSPASSLRGFMMTVVAIGMIHLS